MPTAKLRDVAARAGVSIKTVSNVVNSVNARVSVKTADRVRQAIAELGYRPNLSARHLRTGRSRVLALAVPDLRNPYFAQLAATTIKVARQFEYNVFIEETGDSPEAELNASNGLGDPMIEGVILAPLLLDQSRLQGNDRRVPLVLLGERDPGVPSDRVGFDNTEAGRVLTRHLIEQGYRRIGVVGRPGRLPNATALRRIDGYRQAHAEVGMRTYDSLAPVYPPVAYGRAVAEEQVVKLLKLRRRPDALFCLADVLAFGAIAGAHRLGLSVPDDLGIVGFDGLDEAIHRVPTLTTVLPDLEGMATAAVLALIDRTRAGLGDQPSAIDCSFNVIYGDSTARAVPGGPQPIRKAQGSNNRVINSVRASP